RLFMVGPERGAAASIFAVVTPGLESNTGGYFQRSALRGPRSVHEARASKAGRDMAAAQRLWDVSEQLVRSVTGNRCSANRRCRSRVRPGLYQCLSGRRPAIRDVAVGPGHVATPAARRRLRI